MLLSVNNDRLNFFLWRQETRENMTEEKIFGSLKVNILALSTY